MEHQQRFGNLALFTDDIPEIASLAPEEREFIQHMVRACTPFNRIYRDQNYKHLNTLIDVFGRIADADTPISGSARIYHTYLTRMNNVFDEHTLKQPTFKQLAVPDITLESLRAAAAAVCITDADDAITDLFRDKGAAVVDGSIDRSENNYYGPGITDAIYNSIPADARHINSHFELDAAGVSRDNPYSCTGKYAKELQEVVLHLDAAAIVAAAAPAHFDEATVRSIRLLIDYFRTGDERAFREHCRAWIAANSRVQYTMGFIETYNDPRGIIGEAGAEVSMRVIDTAHLGPLLLEMEQRLPVLQEHKRTAEQVAASRINVNFNKILHGTGAYGPGACIAAYCLPNYDDIRAECGSKQIIYMSNGHDKLGNKELAARIRTPRHKAFIAQYDPDNRIRDDIWDLQCLLHETVGHASGRLGIRADGVPVTADLYDSTMPERSALEELRAEINALYMSVFEVEALHKEGLYKGWLERIGIDMLRERLISKMASTALSRYGGQAEGFTRVTGAHPRANVVIMNWLIECGGIALEEIAVVDGSTDYSTFEIVVKDLAICMDAIGRLCRLVQTIKSTADVAGVTELFEHYTMGPVSIEQGNRIRTALKTRSLAIMEGIEWTARAFPF